MMLRAAWVVVALMVAACAPMRAKVDRGLGLEKNEEFSTVRVFYATDRKRENASHPAKRYGAQRGTTEYGAAYVTIPDNRAMGTLPRPSWLRFEFSEDPKKHVILAHIEHLEAPRFFELLNNRVRQSRRRSAFVFVHGYNVSFEDAALRTAQIFYDIGFDGAPVLYSWPSHGDTLQYTRDEENVRWTASNLRDFLAEFATHSKAERIFLIGHSMGTRALTDAFISLGQARPELRERFEAIVLAAPDIDADVFKRDLAPRLVDRRLTLYANSEDKPLKASHAIHGYPRAGDSTGGVLLVEGMESIDATGMGTEFLNHSYPMQDRSLLFDLLEIVHRSLPASERSQLREVTNGGRRFYRFRRK